MKYTIFLVAALCLFSSGGCREEQSGKRIAKVGDRVLTMEEASTHIDSSRGSYDNQLHDYVSYWINTEILYKEALGEGFDKSQDIQQQLDDIRRQLVNRVYLEKKLEADTSSVDQQAIMNYYDAHKSEFFVREDIIRLNVISFNSREHASRFAAAVTKGETWSAAVDVTQADTSSSGTVVSYTDGQYYTQHTLFPPELWKVASGLSQNEISFPVKTAIGYYVIQSLSQVKSGTQAEFEFVKDEVRQRFLRERYRERYAELLGTLRKKYNVEVYISNAASADTVRNQTNE